MHQTVSAESQFTALSLLRMLRPHRVIGKQKVRVGSFFDGGYIMLDDFQGIEAAYSFGINDDVSWDLDVARRNIPIYQYDHTIDSLPEGHHLFHWSKVGIGVLPDPIAGMETIEGLLHINGHLDNPNLLLKCDIEGAEWGVLRTTPAHRLRLFRQIVLELHSTHFFSEWPHAENARATLFNLLANHKVVHVHGNNYGGWTHTNGVSVPQVIELTLARTDLGEFVVSNERFPTPLDMPCNSALADFYLGDFCFD